MVTSEKLKEILQYDPITGKWIWIKSTNPSKIPDGSQAGTKTHHSGYVYIKISGKKYAAHRLAILYMTGEWPIDGVDHKDMIKSNNIWTNLRFADQFQNHGNRSKNRNNKSGVKGVSWHKRIKKWWAQIYVKGTFIHLGYFDDIDKAAEAYRIASLKHFGEFARVV